MTESQIKFIEGFNAALEGRCLYRYITRDSDLQRTACAELEEMLSIVTAEKAKTIDAADEFFANVLLGCECLTSACIAEIRMWLLLKEGNPDAAWTQLITAQRGLADAMRADPGFANDVARQLERLNKVETLVFPPQTFFSTGWIVKDEICSICGGDYEACEHIKGRPYMGHFCTVQLIPDGVDHVAIVKEPASKHCRAHTIEIGGGFRNVMTLKAGPDSGIAQAETDRAGVIVRGTIATTSSLTAEGLTLL